MGYGLKHETNNNSVHYNAIKLSTKEKKSNNTRDYYKIRIEKNGGRYKGNKKGKPLAISPWKS